ncbi:MAG: tetratricopeptide repeat protein [Planctomycetota bacterium]
MTELVPPAATVTGYGEAERQASELAAIRRMLHASRGCFSLSVAVCNSPTLRDYLVAQLREAFPGMRVVTVPPGTVDVFGLAVAGPANPPPAALFLVNLEASLPSVQKTQPTLRSLNASRELWPRRFSCPIVLWLPEYAATLLCTHARDFWRYRSHGFEFVSEQAGAVAGMAERVPSGLSPAANLSREEKRFRIAELEQRIADAGEVPRARLAQHTAVWLTELGFLYSFTGDLERAEAMLRKSLEIDEKLGHVEGIANDYGTLGVICRDRGDLNRAEEMLRKALAIDEKLGRMEEVANDYGNLGITYRRRGDLDRAEEMLRKALAIHEKLGSTEGLAAGYTNLGIICITRGDLDRGEEMLLKAIEIHEKLGRMEGVATGYTNLGIACMTRGDLDRGEKMSLKALDIHEKLGRMEGVAADYSNLGLIYRGRGDLQRAEEMLRKSLEIEEKLGCVDGIASDYANLGRIAADRGDVGRARELWTKSLDLYRRTGASHRVQEVQGWLDGLGEQA